MHNSVLFAVAAVLLATLNPVSAADLSQNDGGMPAIQKDDSRTATPAAPAGADQDKTAKVIILGPGGLNDIPNPYANPAPRLISDAWAIRT